MAPGLDDIQLNLDGSAQRGLALILAFMMFSVGLGLKFDDFRRVLQRPAIIVYGTALQVIVLPALTLGLTFLVAPSPSIALGMILLLVPGLILFTMWAVALPANTVEGTGVVASLGRSRALTRGRRWRVFGAIMVPTLISAVTSWFLFGIFFGLHGVASTTSQVVSWGVHAVEQAFSVCVFGTLYYHLRRDKEGVDIEQVAAVFD